MRTDGLGMGAVAVVGSLLVASCSDGGSSTGHAGTGATAGADPGTTGGTRPTEGSGGAAGGAPMHCGEAVVEAARAGCRQVASEMCAYFFRCLAEDELAEIEANTGATDASSCAEAVSTGVCTPEAVDDPIRACRQTFYQEDIDACTQTLREFPCLPMADFAIHPVLEEACIGTRGTVPLGGACVDDDDCAGTDGFCNSGECESRSGEQYEILCNEILGPAPCPGGVCLSFVPNVQDVPAFCTRHCTEDDECGLGAICVDAAAGPACMSTCVSDAACSNGLICNLPPGHVVGVCSVDAL